MGLKENVKCRYLRERKQFKKKKKKKKVMLGRSCMKIGPVFTTVNKK